MINTFYTCLFFKLPLAQWLMCRRLVRETANQFPDFDHQAISRDQKIRVSQVCPMNMLTHLGSTWGAVGDTDARN